MIAQPAASGDLVRGVVAKVFCLDIVWPNCFPCCDGHRGRGCYILQIFIFHSGPHEMEPNWFSQVRGRKPSNGFVLHHQNASLCDGHYIQSQKETWIPSKQSLVLGMRISWSGVFS